MVKIGIITGSTRNSRVNLQVAEWILEFAKAHNNNAEFELVDIKEFDLPRFDEVIPPVATDDRPNPNVKRWSDKVKELDGFIFVTPEYNKAVTGGLKDAIDYLASEFFHKAAGIVSYGGQLGISASVMMRPMLGNLKVAVVGPQVTFSMNTDFEQMSKFTPADYHTDSINNMLNDVVSWSEALQTVRNK